MRFRSLFLCAAAVGLFGVAAEVRGDHRRGPPHGRGSHGRPVRQGGFHKGFRGGSIIGPNFGHHRRFLHHLSGHIGLRPSPYYSRFASFRGCYGRYFGGHFGTSSSGGFVGPRYYGSASARRWRAPRVPWAFVIERPPTERLTPWRVGLKKARAGLEGYHSNREGEEAESRPPVAPVEPGAPFPASDEAGIREPRIHSPSVNGDKVKTRRGAILYPDSGEIVRADDVRDRDIHSPRKITGERVLTTAGRALSPELLGQRSGKDTATVTRARKPGTSQWKTVP